MRRRSWLVSLAFLLATAGAAAAQDRPQIGLGLGLQNLTFGSETSLLSQIYVPVRVTPRIMIEPGIGLLRTEEEFLDISATSTLWTLGAGVLFAVVSTEDGDVYVGPRIGVIMQDDEEADGLTHLNLAFVAGGEFFLRRNFSLGGEAGLKYINLDQPADTDESESVLSTVTEFRVRWYFR